MEFRNLQTFLKISELKSFSKAAESLGYTQSAVSIQVQQMEKELGARLFERIGKGVVLTKEGQQFTFYANEILRLSTEAAASIRARSSAPDTQNIIGTLRIGSIESLSTSIIPRLLIRFREKCPKVKVILHTKHRETLINEVLNNEIDLFFIFENKKIIPEMERIVLCRERVLFIAPAAYKNNNTACLKELVREPFLLTESGESYRHELDRLLAANDLEINEILQLSNTETIIHLVEQGQGFSFVPGFSASNALREGRISEICVDMEPVIMWSQLFYHKNKWLTPQMKAFISAAREFFLENG